MEPLVQAAGGILVHLRFLRAARELTHQFNILLILDEIAVGGLDGRERCLPVSKKISHLTFFVLKRTRWILPMAATITTTQIWQQFLGSHKDGRVLSRPYFWG